MSRKQKLLDRLASHPKDFEWDELSTLLSHLGFKKQPGAGSGAMFFHPDRATHVIRLHRPHNRNPPTLLACYVRQVHEQLLQWGYYDD